MLQRANTGISSMQASEIMNEAIVRTIRRLRTMSIWKVIKVNPNQTVNIECCHIDLMKSTIGEIQMMDERSAPSTYTTFDPGVLVDIPYRVKRNGQFRDMVCPAVGDVGTYMPTYDDLRAWFDSGEKLPLQSLVKMAHMNGAGVFETYVQHDKDTQEDYPTDNQTRIIKSNRTKITITDPLDEQGQPTGVETIQVETQGVVFTITGDGIVTATAKTINLSASEQMNITTPQTNISGKVDIGGDTNIGGKADITGDASIGGSATITGTSTAADHISGGINFSAHKHLSATPGTPTGTPQL